MNTTLIPLAAFGFATWAAYAGGTLVFERFLKDRLRVRQRLAERFPTNASNSRTSLFKDLRLLHDETSKLKVGRWQRFGEMVSQSGVDVTAMRIVVLSVLLAWTVGFGTFLFAHWTIAILCTLFAAWAPFHYVLSRRKRRIRVVCEQLPDAFELMSRAVRAGQTMQSAMQIVATQTRAPLALEFARCCEQQNLGLPPAVAMGDLAKRTGVMELQFFVVAMLVQRQAGGNPIDILSNLSDVIRKRIRLQGRVRALTGEGRMQATVLSLLPVVALTVLWFLNRPYAEVLLERPWLLGGVVAAQSVGALWIRQIIQFEF